MLATSSFLKRVSSAEWSALIKLITIGVIGLLFLPDRTIDPWRVLNPHSVILIVVTLASIEFFSHFISKLVNRKQSTILIGFLGGLVSSTAVILTSAKNARVNPLSWRSSALEALTANVASIIELMLIVAVISNALFVNIFLEVALVLSIASLSIFIFYKKTNNETVISKLKPPVNWSEIIRLALLLTLILILIAGAKKLFGDSGSVFVSFLTGFFELHAVSFANSLLFSQNQIDLQNASFNIFLAMGASQVSKVLLSWLVSPGKFALSISLMLAPLIALSALLVYNAR